MDSDLTPRQRCFFILSVKSSGSSVLQRHLAQLCGARLIRATPHSENESLYWTKAASVLGLPQTRMENSEVPIAPRAALAMLESMVRDNAPAFTGNLETEADIFAAWTAIVGAEPGPFIEKSPHHLYQRSVISLMERYADQANTVDVQFIGLVRNPIDTLYSSWRRFGIEPKREERHWLRAYTLLQDFQARRPDLVSIVRYEDLVAGKVDIARLVKADSSTAASQETEMFNTASIQKWRKNRHFGYTPSEAASELAISYGYTKKEIQNNNGGPWWLYRVPRAALWTTFSRLPMPIQRGIKASAKSILS